MNLAIFDIDGTLTETNAVDESCFVQALTDVPGFAEINTNWLEYQFVTDSGIIFQIFAEQFGRPPDESELVNCKSRLVKLLEAQQNKDPSTMGACLTACAKLKFQLNASLLLTCVYDDSPQFLLANTSSQ